MSAMPQPDGPGETFTFRAKTFCEAARQVTAKLEMATDKDHRLRTMCAGAIVGELGMILNEPRTATVVADRDSIIYRLSKEDLGRMEEEAPDLAVAFLEFITHLVSERLANASRAIRVLLE